MEPGQDTAAVVSTPSPPPTAAPESDAADATGGVARRRPRVPRADANAERPRPHRLTPRFSDVELQDIQVAATLAGMTPTGYVAKCAVDVAAQRVRPVPTAMADVIGELLQARYQVQKFSGLVNQAVAKWHATDELPAELTRAIDLVSRILPRLEEAAVAVHALQGGARRRAAISPRAQHRAGQSGQPVPGEPGPVPAAAKGSRRGSRA